mgnify:CR=1 FL=1
MAIFTVPIVMGVAAVASAVAGGKKAYDGHQKSQEADEKREKANELIEDNKDRLEAQRKETEEKLANLGELKIRVQGDEIKSFLNSFGQILKPKEITKLSGNGEELQKIGERVEIPTDMAQSADTSQSLIEQTSGGLVSLGSGVLLAAGAYNLPYYLSFGSYAVASSTGTAISGLSGAAAKSATFAWLGGGSLASGGFGVAGGTAILGGAIAGPALLVGGWLYSAKGEEKLADAEEFEAEALEAVEEMRMGRDRLKDISEFVERYSEVISKLQTTLQTQNQNLYELVERKRKEQRQMEQENIIKRIFLRFFRPDPLNAKNFSDSEKMVAYKAYTSAMLLHSALSLNLMDEEGELTSEAQEGLQEIQQKA